MIISIITVSFNSEATISETLNSVSSQDYSHIEHILIDGGSTDATLDIVKSKGSHLAKVISEPDSGIYDAMNKGLACATGEVVGFLNSDDVFNSISSVSTIADAFSDGLVDAAYGDLVLISDQRSGRIIRYWRPGSYKSGACLKGWMAPHPTFYARREVLQRNHGFDTRYKLQADFDLMVRLFEVDGINSKYLPTTLIRMLMGGATTGSLKNIIKGNIEAERSCRRNGFSAGPLFLFRKILSRLPQLVSRPDC